MWDKRGDYWKEQFDFFTPVKLADITARINFIEPSRSLAHRERLKFRFGIMNLICNLELFLHQN
jgi:hypothetical protein